MLLRLCEFFDISLHIFLIYDTASSCSRMPRHSCCEVRVMQLHDILLLRTSASLHSVSVGAKPLSTGQCAPCRRLYQLGVISQLIYLLRIYLSLCKNLLHRNSFQPGDLLCHILDICRFISLATVRLRCQVRAIRFQYNRCQWYCFHDTF